MGLDPVGDGVFPGVCLITIAETHMGRDEFDPSERQLMEQLNFNMLFRWFVGLGLDARVGRQRSATTGSLLEAEVSAQLLRHHKVRGLLRASFFGRRNIDRGLGVDEELSSQR